jgi:HSP20 family protein
MNELRMPDLFDIEPFPSHGLRSLWRPWRADGSEGAPQIRLDVRETDAAYTVKAEIAGVRKEDIDVQVNGNQVTISADVKQEKEERDGGRVLRSERRYGYASRSFTLGSAVDPAAVKARYESGVLELTLPKVATSESRRITVN